MIDLYLMIFAFGSILAFAVVGYVIVVLTDHRDGRPSEHKVGLQYGAARSA